MGIPKLNPIMISGAEVLPLVEGGKGIAISDGLSSGLWAAEGGVGTFSAVNAHIPGQENLSALDSYSSKIRIKRHAEMIERAILGGISQAKIAYETACGRGRIHMNVMWEMGSVEAVLHGILSKVKNLIHGVTCGAGMPFRLAEICAKYNIKYYPIVSSARAFNILWRRAYSRLSEWLGGVVYEDPWLAGGHNGLSNNEDENTPEPPEPRVRSLRSLMRSFGISDLVPIFVAGGVWRLSEWTDWIANPDLGAIAFQFGTRPLLTVESPIPLTWKKALFTLKRGDIVLNRFSPTGFPSSAARNTFLRQLQARSDRQVLYAKMLDEQYTEPFHVEGPNARGQKVFLAADDGVKVRRWIAEGYSVALVTPSHTLVFVTPDESARIDDDRIQCVGCLSACNFSGWSQEPQHSPAPDPRYFCIQKSLQMISTVGDVENALMFCGHQGYRFAEDPFYAGGRIPSVRELFAQICSGE
ncbi:MAG: nitronate monooxygenase [Holosporales bacterium]|jgi:NAD(P)H-dependent flavin oxidoreductase YrpB (nitropropane dioxygenase family)|nr:nitronate monooxygenase [Holosporales bacterium]